ncbi:MAG: CopG family transcriptional regulator [Terricaulis sp.]
MSAKKTETLEIRLSAETKTALQAKARADGTSVSEVLRRLIERYLRSEASGVEHRRMIMRLSSFAAAAAALVLGLLAVAPAAHAGGLVLGLTTLVQVENANARFVQSQQTSLDLQYGTDVMLCLPASGAAPAAATPLAHGGSCDFQGGQGYTLSIRADAAPDDSVMIHARVLNTASALGREASVLLKLNSSAALQASTSAGETLRLTFFPRKA